MSQVITAICMLLQAAIFAFGHLDCGRLKNRHDSAVESWVEQLYRFLRLIKQKTPARTSNRGFRWTVGIGLGPLRKTYEEGAALSFEGAHSGRFQAAATSPGLKFIISWTTSFLVLGAYYHRPFSSQEKTLVSKQKNSTTNCTTNSYARWRIANIWLEASPCRDMASNGPSMDSSCETRSVESILEANRMKIIIKLLLPMMLLAGSLSCNRPSSLPEESKPAETVGDPQPAVHTYGYVFWEATIVKTSHIVLNGQEMAIEFREDSDPLALKSLRSLKWNVLYENCKGKDIFVVGQYFEEPKHTPDRPDMPPRQEYHDFRLLDWYILTPFTEVRWKDEQPLNDFVHRQRDALSYDDFYDDFRKFEGKQSLDLSRFQRPREKSAN